MRTPTRFVFDFDEAQTTSPNINAHDCDLLTRMVVERDREHATEREGLRAALEFIATREGPVHQHASNEELCTHPACIARRALAEQGRK